MIKRQEINGFNKKEEEILLKEINSIIESNDVLKFLKNNKKSKFESLLLINIDLTYSTKISDNNTKDVDDINIYLEQSIKDSHIVKIQEYVRENISNYVNLKPILLTFKKILDYYNLNDTWHGGISSYMLFLIILSNFKYQSYFKINPETMGDIFFFILDFFAVKFKFENNYIQLDSPNPYCLNLNLESIPMIIDPISGNNASKSAYKILEIQEKLLFIFQDILKRSKISSKKNDELNVKSKESIGLDFDYSVLNELL